MKQATSRSVSRRGTSARDAVVLAMVALAFFGGAMLAQYSGSPQVGIGLAGLALVAFLLVAMTRNPSKRGRRPTRTLCGDELHRIDKLA